MTIHPHAAAVAALPAKSVWALRDYFMLPETAEPLWDQTRALGLWQADLALALLRLGDRDGVEVLLGRPITVCPPCLAGASEPPPTAERRGDDRRIHLRVRNPRLPTSDAGMRWRWIRSGRTTIAEYVARGGTRRDLREMRIMGWAEFLHPLGSSPTSLGLRP
jgi:hypothetical protein